MKNLILLLTVLFAFTACKQSSTSREVPENIKMAFVKSHPYAIILKWNDEPPFWEVKYKESTEKGAVSYDENAVITETELVITKDLLPNGATIPNYIKANYPKEKMQGYEKITTASGTITYEIQIPGKEIVFDANGKYLLEEKD
ncbi:hypothetical protein [Flavobacterium sp. 7A]|uniref:hypothetical protein n=1 Tax=Flavobacterium sp. 7A TaxID=2940571 RepID=UPI0022262DE1|nr:hypothetical protein [Flavobacterium sp. 7A]MCW2118254.1 Tfp pilus assembly protein PilP [Flavobacterium sp. 7A]